jgi:hypothetical protein
MGSFFGMVGPRACRNGEGGVLRVCYPGGVLLLELRGFCKVQGIPLIEREAGRA